MVNSEIEHAGMTGEMIQLRSLSKGTMIHCCMCVEAPQRKGGLEERACTLLVFARTCLFACSVAWCARCRLVPKSEDHMHSVP